jgi:hypothetical protein
VSIAELEAIVGERIWLEYFDQNYKFEQAFTPQYCKVLRRYTGVNGANDWYLVELGTPVVYEGHKYSHLVIRSRWDGRTIGGEQATAVFIVLVPDADSLTDPFEMDRTQYIAWGIAAREAAQVKR